jgi:hypothetical protein
MSTVHLQPLTSVCVCEARVPTSIKARFIRTHCHCRRRAGHGWRRDGVRWQQWRQGHRAVCRPVRGRWWEPAQRQRIMCWSYLACCARRRESLERRTTFMPREEMTCVTGEEGHSSPGRVLACAWEPVWRHQIMCWSCRTFVLDGRMSPKRKAC